MISSGMLLVDQEFVFMQDNDLEPTSKHCQRHIKSKDEQHVLQLMSWPVQSVDLNPIDLTGMNLTKTRDKQHTSAAHQ